MPSGQVHIGIWLMTSQIALDAHVPGHGSTHFLLKQALSLGQSVFSIHSGRQPVYGFPWYSGKQAHTPSLQIAFAPHGDGLHLSFGGGTGSCCGIG